MKGGEAIIKSLTDQGVEVVFGYPGGVLLPLYDVLYDSDLKHILVRHEQCAAHAADGFARASGKVGVCIGTSGPGATNLITGIATAYMDSSPILAIAGQVASHLIGNDAFQEVDTIGITMPITKHNFQPMKAEEIPGMIKAGFYIAETGRNGPVVLDLPKDVQEEEFDYDQAKDMDLPGYKPNKKGHPLQVKKAAELILNSKMPVILAGGGIILSNASDELLKFSKLVEAPVTTTLMGKGSFPEDDQFSLGMLGMHGKTVSNYIVDECDCLIAIGCRFSDRTTGLISEFAQNAKIIHIDIDPAEIGKNVDIDVPIVGDAKNVLNNLIKIVSNKNTGNKSRTTWLNHVLKFKNTCTPSLSYADSIPLKPQQVIKELYNAINDDTIITTDVGQNQMWMARYFTSRNPRKFISSGGLGTMGFGFPAAIGAKIAMPDNDVVAVCGDGGFLMVCQDLATINEYDIPLVICVFDNRRLGMVSQWQRLFYNKRISYTQLGQSPDFVKLAESFGVNAERVDKPGEMELAVKNAIRSGEPYLIDVIIDADEVLPIVPPGCGLTEIVGEYKVEQETPGEILYKTNKKERGGG